MNFDFSTEQKAFGEQLRRSLDDAGSIAETRRCLEGQARHSTKIWADLAALGALGAALPEEFGGAGLSHLESCIVAEEIGRAMAPVPFVSSIALCAETISRFGNEEQKLKWLPALLDGSLVGTAAWAEAAGELRLDQIKTEYGGGKLTGRKVAVLDGMIADVAIVLAADAAGRPTLCLVDLNATGVERRVVDSVDPSKPLADLTFSQAAAEPIGAAGDFEFTSMLDRAAIVLAFEQLGAADRALTMARDYALQRHSFGRAIGAHQAIKHKLADMFVKVEVARMHAYWAAWALATGASDLPLAAASARVTATEALSFAAQEGLQVHGGIGYTWESDCQLLYKRARLYALTFGSALLWKERITSFLENNNLH
jgi:alkylation response protein AidB-like acyl-CoA dehydrogenase